MNHLRLWEGTDNFIIAWSNQYVGYAVWQREPAWYYYNSVSEYFKTIEEARNFINNLS